MTRFVRISLTGVAVLAACPVAVSTVVVIR
jgi:hypothetical protein